MVGDIRGLDISLERAVGKESVDRTKGSAKLARIPIYLSLCLVFFGLSLSLPLFGQTSRGTVLGHITDSSGAIVSGAKVTLRNVNTGTADNLYYQRHRRLCFCELDSGNLRIGV